MINSPYQRLGNYRLIRPLGSGSFSMVYLGEHMYLQTQAAIKVLRMQASDTDLEQFLAEARTIARLRHPAIVELLEFGIDDHIPFLVMEYAPRGSLRQQHPLGSRLPPDRIVAYIRQIATGLQYAHNARLIHRDIKPENILLGADDEVLLSDFGTALVVQTLYQQTQDIAGTPTYMAPEQLRGKPVPASDQYALGIVVYEWLSGNCPFSGSSFQEIITKHLFEPPPSLRTSCPDVPPIVEQVVMTALAKNPQERFANVEEFAWALEEACKQGSQTRLAVQTPRSLPQADPALRTPQKMQRLPGSIMGKAILFFLLPVLIIIGCGWLYYNGSSWQSAPASKTDSNDPQLLYTKATSSKPAYDTNMQHNDSSWSWMQNSLVQDGNSNCVFSGGAFYAIMQKNGISPCLAEGPVENDFAYQAQMVISAGDEGGLIFRSDNTSVDQNNNPTLSNYYFFSISQNGHYNLYYQSNKSKILLARGSSSSINKGLNQANLLTVIARGSNIYLYVNQHYVAHVSNGQRSSGYVGVFAQSETTATNVEFSHATIWETQ